MNKEKPIRFQINFQKGKSETYTLLNNEMEIRDNDICIQLEYEKFSGGEIGKIKMDLKNDPCRINYHLEMEHPIKIFWECEERPEKMTAMYLFNEWWTRPVFIDSYEKIPDQTQILFMKHKDYYACMIPMVGEQFKTYLMPGTQNELCFEMTAYLGGISKLYEPLYIMTKDDTMDSAVHKAFEQLKKYKGIRLRNDRNLPEMFRYLGWCSWDAFYVDITEEKVREKAKEFQLKNIPVKWMLMDDGWMSSSNECLRKFEPDEKKFPNGFRSMIEDIRKESDITWFGVWHTLGGYWGGIVPDSDLVSKEEAYLFHTVNGKVLPSPQNGAGFFIDWYTYLRSEGIDFTKVDCQSAIRNYYENSMAISKAAKGTNYALESASAWMNGAIINCMGMAMENMLARPNTAISRNSDDFVPAQENGFTEHLLQNAYNSVYHNELYYCDWDMFWTDHKDSEKHAFLRAISGGPVYFSDRIGETKLGILSPLMYKNGELLMMDRSAKPTEDCIFMDPIKNGILKLTNVSTWENKKIAGGIAAFNLTKQEQNSCFSPQDIPELSDAEEYWIYDYFKKQAVILEKQQLYGLKLSSESYGWYLVFPKNGKNACIGLIDKYAGFMAVECMREKDNMQTIVVKEKGKIGWLSEYSPQKVIADGEDVTEKVQKISENVYELVLPIDSGKCAVTILWSTE